MRYGHIEHNKVRMSQEGIGTVHQLLFPAVLAVPPRNAARHSPPAAHVLLIWLNLPTMMMTSKSTIPPMMSRRYFMSCGKYVYHPARLIRLKQKARLTFHHIAFLTLLAPLLKPCADTASVSGNMQEHQASEIQRSQHLILYARVSATDS